MNSASTRRGRLLRLLFVSAVCALTAMAIPSFASAAVTDDWDDTTHPCQLDATPEIQSVDKAGNATITVQLNIDNPGCFWPPDSQVLVQALKYQKGATESDPPTPVVDGSNQQIVRAQAYFDENGKATLTIPGGVDCVEELLKIRAHPPVDNCELRLGCIGGQMTWDFVAVNWTGCQTPPPPPTTPPVVEQKAAPQANLALSKKCTRQYMLVRPSADNGTIKSVSVYVNGKKIKTLTSSPFSYKLPMSKVTSPRSTVRVVYTFTDGSTATVSRKFRICARLTAHRNQSPGFTG